MNPFNPDAGSTPAPVDPADIALVEDAARAMWRAVPYFASRYGERGRAFGRSDAGYLVTLSGMDEATARAQVAWLAGVLAPRGMPSLLLEIQLEILGRIATRREAPGAGRFLGLAAELRAKRLGALDALTAQACEDRCRRAGPGQRRRGAGLLIAAAVADRATGLGDHDEALVRWLAEAEPGDSAWATACTEARALAISRCPRLGGVGR